LRTARALQRIAGKAKEAAGAFGLDHLLGREAELVQVFDQACAFACVGDPRGFQRVEVDHLQSVSGVACALGCFGVSETEASEVLHGPLEERHRQLGASFAEFSGWLMPVAYAGTVSEHTATRTTVGLFDVSHLGKALVRGPGAAEYVNSALTNDLRRIGPGKAQYTLCCTDSGGVIDDLIAYYASDDEIFLVPNAANTPAVVAALQERAPAGLTITDEHRSYAVLAVQGPKSTDVVGGLGLPTEMDYMGYADAEFGGVPVRVCRTGYTGEHGYELLPTWDQAGVVFDALVDAVGSAGGELAGLGARDTLRTEMGYPLHGHELSLEISPLQAGCGWAIGWKKDAFWGREALIAEKEAGPKRVLRGLRAVGRGVLRPDLAVLDGDTQIGVTTSGTFSPGLKIGIALALIDTDKDIADGQQVSVDVRGRALECEVVKPPFVEAKTR
jgi:aminomethyltransferase